jgi:hypothetical protein
MITALYLRLRRFEPAAILKIPEIVEENILNVIQRFGIFLARISDAPKNKGVRLNLPI